MIFYLNSGHSKVLKKVTDGTNGEINLYTPIKTLPIILYRFFCYFYLTVNSSKTFSQSDLWVQNI